jgi:hypothetical protein
MLRPPVLKFVWHCLLSVIAAVSSLLLSSRFFLFLSLSCSVQLQKLEDGVNGFLLQFENGLKDAQQVHSHILFNTYSFASVYICQLANVSEGK